MTSFKVSILLTVIFFISNCVKGDITFLIKSEIQYCKDTMKKAGFMLDSEFADFNVAMQYGRHENGYILFKNYVDKLFDEDEENKSSEEISYKSVIPLKTVKFRLQNFYNEIISNNINCFPQVVLTPSQFCIKILSTSNEGELISGSFSNLSLENIQSTSNEWELGSGSFSNLSLENIQSTSNEWELGTNESCFNCFGGNIQSTSGERKIEKGQPSSSRSYRRTQSTSSERELEKGQPSSSRSYRRTQSTIDERKIEKGQSSSSRSFRSTQSTSGERKIGKGQSSSSRSFRSTQSTSGERKIEKGQSSSSRSFRSTQSTSNKRELGNCINEILRRGVYTEDDQYSNAVNSYSIYSGTIDDLLNNTTVANWPKYALAYYQFHIAQYYTKNEYSQFNYAKWCETSVQTFFKVEPFLPEKDRRQNYQE